MKYTKLDENTVKITKTVEETRDYETLVAQRDGIIAQMTKEHEEMAVRDAERQALLDEIENALATGIKSTAEIEEAQKVAEESVISESVVAPE